MFLSALAPVLLHLNPILGSLIGVVATLIFVAIAIIVIIRLKSYKDNKRSATQSEICATNPTNTELLNKGSVESLEDKNPDIVPSLNVYVTSDGGFCTMKVCTTLAVQLLYLSVFSLNFKRADEIAYPQYYKRQQAIPMSMIRRQETSFYSHFDVGKEVSQPLNQSFHTLQHPQLFNGAEEDVEFEFPLIKTRGECNVSTL